MSETGPEGPMPEEIKESQITKEEKEFELTPEIEEKIMEKVRDIDRYGTAFSSLSFLSSGDREQKISRLGDVFEKGLLGNTGTGHKYDSINERIAEWYKVARPHDFGHCMIWFNIVGRMKPIIGKHQIDKTSLIGYGDVGIIFDISNFQELPPWRYREMQNEPEKYKRPIQNTFSVDEERGIFYPMQKIVDVAKNAVHSNKLKRSGYKPYDYEGFLTPYRIPPRFFQGLVTRCLVENMIDEEIQPVIDSMTSIYRQTPEKLLPIYDTMGNLLWPRKMSYKEVKQFVAERDKGKENEGKIASADDESASQ